MERRTGRQPRSACAGVSPGPPSGIRRRAAANQRAAPAGALGAFAWPASSSRRHRVRGLPRTPACSTWCARAAADAPCLARARAARAWAVRRHPPLLVSWTARRTSGAGRRTAAAPPWDAGGAHRAARRAPRPRLPTTAPRSRTRARARTDRRRSTPSSRSRARITAQGLELLEERRRDHPWHTGAQRQPIAEELRDGRPDAWASCNV